MAAVNSICSRLASSAPHRPTSPKVSQSPNGTPLMVGFTVALVWHRGPLGRPRLVVGFLRGPPASSQSGRSRIHGPAIVSFGDGPPGVHRPGSQSPPCALSAGVAGTASSGVTDADCRRETTAPPARSASTWAVKGRRLEAAGFTWLQSEYIARPRAGQGIGVQRHSEPRPLRRADTVVADQPWFTFHQIVAHPVDQALGWAVQGFERHADMGVGRHGKLARRRQ